MYVSMYVYRYIELAAECKWLPRRSSVGPHC